MPWCFEYLALVGVWVWLVWAAGAMAKNGGFAIIFCYGILLLGGYFTTLLASGFLQNANKPARPRMSFSRNERFFILLVGVFNFLHLLFVLDVGCASPIETLFTMLLANGILCVIVYLTPLGFLVGLVLLTYEYSLRYYVFTRFSWPTCLKHCVVILTDGLLFLVLSLTLVDGVISYVTVIALIVGKGLDSYARSKILLVVESPLPSTLFALLPASLFWITILGGNGGNYVEIGYFSLRVLFGIVVYYSLFIVIFHMFVNFKLKNMGIMTDMVQSAQCISGEEVSTVKSLALFYFFNIVFSGLIIAGIIILACIIMSIAIVSMNL